jgi:hypothetical protein
MPLASKDDGKVLMDDDRSYSRLRAGAGCCARCIACSRHNLTMTGAQPIGCDRTRPVSSPQAGGKVGLVRGVVKRLDPIHDQLLIHAFGGGDIRIAFDARTQLLPENTARV